MTEHEPNPRSGYCHLCNEDVPTTKLLDHVRLLHPDVYEEPETWPDGRRVVYDDTLRPADFTRGPRPDPAVRLGWGARELTDPTWKGVILAYVVLSLISLPVLVILGAWLLLH